MRTSRDSRSCSPRRRPTPPACCARRSATPTQCCSSSTSGATAPYPERCRLASTSSRSATRWSRVPALTSRSSPTATNAIGASKPRIGSPKTRGSRPRSSTCGRSRRWTSARSSRRSAGPLGRWSSTRTTAPMALAPRSRPPSRRKPCSTWTRPSSGSAAPTSLRCRTPLRWNTSTPSRSPTTSTARCATSPCSDPPGPRPCPVQPACPIPIHQRHVGEPVQTRRPPSRPGRRDALVVGAACTALFAVGALTGSFDRLEPVVTRTNVGDEVVAAFFLVAIGVAFLAIRGSRRAERETALRAEADEQIRALIAESPVVSFTWLPQEHRYRYVSPQIETLFGVSADDHAHDWSAQIHPDDKDRVAEISRTADSDGATYVAEYRIIRPDGEIRWIHDESAYYELDDDGRPRLAQGVMFDITERKRAEERAAAAEERYRTLVEKVPAISYVWDSTFAQGTAPALYISPQIEQMLGVPAESWIDDPMAWSTHAHPDDETRVTAAWIDATDSGTPFSAEYRLRTTAGEWRWVRDEANPVGQGPGGGHLYQGVIVDITERHDSEEAARTAEQRWRLLLEHLPLVAYQISVRDDDTIIDRWVASGVERLFGITVDEWLGDLDAWNNAIHLEDRAGVLSAWERMQDGDEPFDRQYRIVHRDGRVLWVHDRATCTSREGTRVVEGAFVDITGRRAAEAARDEAEGRFRTLVEQLPAITFIEDAVTGEDLYISPQIETMYGYTAEEWTGDPHLWETRLHPDDRDRIVASNAADDGKDVWSVDYRSFTRG